MMKSSSIASVERELRQHEEIDPPERRRDTIRPPRHHDPLFDPVHSLPTNFAMIPGAQNKPAPFSIKAFSEELQREMEAMGLRTPVTQSVDSSQFLGSDEPPSGRFDSIEGWVKKRRSPKEALGDCYKSYQKCTRTVTDSMIIIILYVILMAFASHATYMGFSFIGKCPWSSKLPPFYAALGMCTLVALAARTFYPIQRRYFPMLRIYIDRLLFSGAVFLFFVLFIAQCVLYYSRWHEPTEDGETSCSRYFYNYVRVTNWCIPIGFVVMAILHGPTSLWMTTFPCWNDRYTYIAP